MHGGASPGAPRGKANGSYKHGRFTTEAIESRRSRGEHSLQVDRVDVRLRHEQGNLVIDVLQAATVRGCGLILVTHDWEHANRMGRVLRLSEGLLHEADRYDEVTR